LDNPDGTMWQKQWVTWVNKQQAQMGQLLSE
jgi:hypothetical protein